MDYFPVISVDLQSGRRVVSVEYIKGDGPPRIPFSMVGPCCVFLMHHRPSHEVRLRFSDFYNVGEFPYRVGLGDFASNVAPPPAKPFQRLIDLIGHMTLSDFTRFPNLKEAISWPLGEPSLAFFDLSSTRVHRSDDIRRDQIATLAMRSCKIANDLEDSFVGLHRMIVTEAILRGIDLCLLPGFDLMYEVAHVQCVRLLQAAKEDISNAVVPNSALIALMEESLMLRSSLPSMMGRNNWIPVVPPIPDVEMESGEESDDDGFVEVD
uniref:Non-structural protein NS-S n=2 Tax=Rift valley fever virus TaxID=11588 RepID=A0A6G5NIZ0_RVFV|nr:nonstructural protein [Rift Valley fever virus]QBH70237.1 nonstructural protein [Rift Valley fever virus]WES12330.1 nonstructural protein [Rift Valley fever virus]WES12332.1 nonstructural protein [Rift Valley fever virus]WES12334.1 nonstructural protein [Rift Valley fever virus]